ncbi:polar amino acid transport system substrate-binding protein [Inhella inkyongensis]|uniref:Polar amino acid transport system substrate-binding protein n=1 Tax=Inhella inkyongensis TaxID=392593 RepID=A0A840S7Q4_9BURK|nr:transporter substrate-binding domain-containing protein [Inhella inkyongensis]MBB5205046.1 polar amino acid transport system substrate-binding protein [Inhella inkyongensis]
MRRKLKPRVGWISLCWVLLSWAPLAQACGPFSLAFYEFGLLYYLDEQGQERGIDLDVVNALRERSGCRIDTRLDSRPRIWSQLANGQLDLSVSGIANAEREQFAEFVPYFYSRNMLVLRRGVPVSARDPEGFLKQAELRIAVVKSFKHGSFFDAWLEPLRAQPGRVIEAGDTEAVVRLFKVGRVDAFIAPATSWLLAARRHGIDREAELLDWARREPVVGGLILSRRTVAEADRKHLRQALQSLLADGTVEKILRHHVGPELAASMALPHGQLEENGPRNLGPRPL